MVSHRHQFQCLFDRSIRSKNCCQEAKELLHITVDDTIHVTSTKLFAVDLKYKIEKVLYSETSDAPLNISVILSLTLKVKLDL